MDRINIILYNHIYCYVNNLITFILLQFRGPSREIIKLLSNRLSRIRLEIYISEVTEELG